MTDEPGKHMDQPSMQQRVQSAVLSQLAEHGLANVRTTALMVPGSDARDMVVALENLVDDASIEGPTWRLGTLMGLTEAGVMVLTERGKTRVDPSPGQGGFPTAETRTP
jgi:hypothetical protein